MKKSDFVSKLIDFHEEIFPSVGRGLSQSDYFSEMLDMLEQEGMLPPYTGVGEKDDWGYEVFENKWDDEDEK